MHTAILAREVRRGTLGRNGKLPDMSVWLLRDPAERMAEANSKVLSGLATIAVRMGAKEASKKLRAERKARAEKRRNRKR